MPTYIYPKKDFIAFIENQVKDDEVVVFTNELTGSMSHSEKSGIKVTHRYSVRAFNDKGIGHIAFGETQPIGVLIVKTKRISPEGIEAMNKICNEQEIKT